MSSSKFVTASRRAAPFLVCSSPGCSQIWMIPKSTLQIFRLAPVGHCRSDLTSVRVSAGLPYVGSSMATVPLKQSVNVLLSSSRLLIITDYKQCIHDHSLTLSSVLNSDLSSRIQWSYCSLLRLILILRSF